MSAETLLDVFGPPEGMVGHSAALVAMTGTEDFLEDALQRLTGLRPRQRAELGNVFVYLMLDGARVVVAARGLPTGARPRSSRVPAARGRSSLAPARNSRAARVRTAPDGYAGLPSAGCAPREFHVHIGQAATRVSLGGRHPARRRWFGAIRVTRGGQRERLCRRGKLLLVARH